jgi:hypothetical protein
MSAVNRNNVTIDLRDVLGRTITDQVDVKFINQRVQSLSQRFPLSFSGSALDLKGVPARPNGLAQVFITPQRYREKSVFVDVPSSGECRIEETLLIDPGRVEPVFPGFQEIGSNQVFADLFRVLPQSGISTDAAWTDLDKMKKAGLLNLYAKMRREKIEGDRNVFSFIRRITEFRPQRVFALVDPRLIDLVRDRRDLFSDVNGALHEFSGGFTRIEGGSFKTRESAGNLQLTFAENAAGELLADIDIDDHQGVLHVFDVLRHKLTGENTNPFNIHQVLVFIQGIDPGYQLA